MAYRGGDLDLRTPRTWSASQSDTLGAAPGESAQFSARARGNYAPGPIWVDEVVLACVNHAFDVALAHRSAEVRLEHLLHALTRIDQAAEVLEARGVRVAQLRRETATVIASEIPVGLTNGAAAPQRSEELEHVLRAASLIAARRNAPASIDDLLHLLIDVEPDLPGLALLARVTPRYADAPAPRSQTYAAYVEPVRDRPVAPAAPPPQRPRAPRVDVSATPVDNIQNSRLDVLEQMVRALSADLGAERQAFSAMLQQLQRDMAQQREDSQRLGGGLADSLQSVLKARLGALEETVSSLRRSTTVDIAPVVDRVANLERSISASLEQFGLVLATLENDLRKRPASGVDLTPLTNRLDIIEEAVLSREQDKTITQRLSAIEDALAGDRARSAEARAALRGEIGLVAEALDRQRATIPAAVVEPLTDRLTQMTHGLETRHSELTSTLAEKIAQLDALIRDYAQKSFEAQAVAREELAEVHEALMKLNQNQHTLAASIENWRSEGRQATDALAMALTERTAAIGAEIGALAPKVSGFDQRFAALESENQRSMGVLEGLSATVEKMHRATVERYYRRNRFRYWLFGTDDWVAASWPSQSQRIADELQAVRSAPPARRG